MRRTPAAAAASSTFSVPLTFVSYICRRSATGMPSLYTAARWKTASAPLICSARRCRSPRSPSTRWATGSPDARSRERTRAATSSPRSVRRATSRRPRKPVPPVTKALTAAECRTVAGCAGTPARSCAQTRGESARNWHRRVAVSSISSTPRAEGSDPTQGGGVRARHPGSPRLQPLRDVQRRDVRPPDSSPRSRVDPPADAVVELRTLRLRDPPVPRIGVEQRNVLVRRVAQLPGVAADVDRQEPAARIELLAVVAELLRSRRRAVLLT